MSPAGWLRRQWVLWRYSGWLADRYARGECLACGHPLLVGERVQNHQHVVCLWAATVGHEYGFCGCTGYTDLYEAGKAGRGGP